MEMINEILDKIIGTLNVDMYLEDAFTYLKAMDPLPKLLGLLGAGVVVFMGLWTLIKTLSKIIIVLAIIAALYFVFQGSLLDGIIG